MAGAFSTYMKNQIVAWVRGTSVPAPPANFGISLHSADPGGTGANELVTGTSPSYARVSVAASTGAWTAASDSEGGRLTDNVANITFPTATGDWVVATHWGQWDATGVGAGNFIFGGPLDTPLTCLNGEQKYIPVGNLNLIIGPTTT